jgi:hypothetical protein
LFWLGAAAAAETGLHRESMRRQWNWLVWVGFAVALLAALSYIPVFARFAVTRDFPWVTFLLFLAAGCFLIGGLRRAFGNPDQYRGRIIGPILSAASLVVCGLFCYGIFYTARDINALRVGQRAPEFSLAGADGKVVTLSELLQGKRAILLIFYRGYW